MMFGDVKGDTNTKKYETGLFKSCSLGTSNVAAKIKYENRQQMNPAQLGISSVLLFYHGTRTKFEAQEAGVRPATTRSRHPGLAPQGAQL